MKSYQKYLAFVLLVLVIFIIYFYIKNKQEFEDRVHTVLINLLDKKIATQKTKAFNFALALSQNDNLQIAIKNHNAKKSYKILKNYMTTLETFSGSQVRIQIVLPNFTIFARSWDNTDAGVNVKKNRPDLIEIKHTLMPHLSFEAARRLVLIASIPIIKDKELLGFLEVIQRFSSMERYFANYDIGLIVLLDDKYEKQAVLLNKSPRIKNMIVANNGANINHIEELKKIDLKKLRNHGFIEKDNYVFFYKSILNSNSQNIGSFILILSKNRVKLFSAFENELDSFFTYARKDLYYSITSKHKDMNPYCQMTNRELLSLKKCTNSQDKKYIETRLAQQLQKYTKKELISLLLETNSNTKSRGKIK